MARAVRSSDAPEPIGPYSQAIVADGTLFCSGMIAIDPQTGEIAGSGAAEQADRALRNLGAVLQAGGMEFENVVKTTLYLADMNDFSAVNEVYAKYFDGAKPARSTIAVKALPRNALVEIDAIAKE